MTGRPEKRSCRATTVAGKPCRSPVVLEDGFCNRHTPAPERRVDAREFGRVGGLASVETRREQAKSVRDRLRERTEAEFEKVWQAFQDGLTATTDEGAPDSRTRLAAATALLAEAYGRPAVAIEGGDRPVDFRLVSLLALAREAEGAEVLDGSAAGELEAGGEG